MLNEVLVPQSGSLADQLGLPLVSFQTQTSLRGLDHIDPAERLDVVIRYSATGNIPGYVTRKLADVDLQWPRRFARHDTTFDCTGHVAGLSAVIRSTEPYGVCTNGSIYFSAETHIPMLDMYKKGITFRTGRVNSASQLDRMLQLVGEGLDSQGIKTAIHELDDETPEHLANAPRSQKLIFTQPPF